jgi:hypothetical protein
MHGSPLGRRLGSYLLVGALLLPVSLGGCGSSGGASTPRDTTVLVYMIGTNLESQHAFATGNINEMISVGSTTGMNVVLQTGGAKQRGTAPADATAMEAENIDWTRVQRYLVHKGSLERIEDMGPDQKDTPLDMGSGATLEAFLKWGVETYPARKYIVVLWDHGGGVNSGVGDDEVTESAISVPAISKALTAANSGLNDRFTIAGFDTCLMATAEVAGSLAPSSRYLVASQDLEPGMGWDYAAFLTFVASDPEAGGAAIGIKIADSYKNKILGMYPATSITLSVTDLSKATDLSNATDSFANTLQEYLKGDLGTDYWTQIALARVNVLDWDTSAIFWMTADLVDMSAFVTRVVANLDLKFGEDPVLTARGATLKSAIAAAVVHKIGSGSDGGATGLTLYFPSILSTYKSKGYPGNTMVDGRSFFAPSYTSGTTGFVEAYFKYYESHRTSLEASVKLDGLPADPFSAAISNAFDYVLASHQGAEPCKLFTGVKASAPSVSDLCFHGMQLAVDSTPPPPGGKEWKVNFDPAKGWPHIWDFPVVMIPDRVDLNRTGKFASYLVPVFLYDDERAEYEAGYLSVEDTGSVDPAIPRYKVSGFQWHAVRPGKTAGLTDGQVYALGAYYRGSFLRTDRTVMVVDKTLQVSDKPVVGGRFGYFVTDLTGAIHESELVDYDPPEG